MIPNTSTPPGTGAKVEVVEGRLAPLRDQRPEIVDIGHRIARSFGNIEHRNHLPVVWIIALNRKQAEKGEIG